MAVQAPELQRGLSDAFRAAFGNHPAAVAVVTAAGARGPVGITASSVISVSADPALLAFNVSVTRGSAAEILTADSLLVHLLTTANTTLAAAFASPSTERFGADMPWSALADGEPLLHGVGTVLRCDILSRTPAGPATLIVAQVREILDGGSPAEPLLYHRRGYHSLGEHSLLA